MQNNRNRNTASRSSRQTASRTSQADYTNPGQWMIWADRFIVQPVKDAWQVLKNPGKPDLSGFKKTRKHRPDYQILVFTGLLMMIGLIIMYAIGPQRANVLNNAYNTDYYTDNFFFIKQLTMLGLSLFVFFAVGLVPIDFIYKHANKLLILAYLSCLLLAVLGALKLPLAQCDLGACRWYNLGPFGFQPSELLKVGVLLSLAIFLGAKAAAGKLNDYKETLLPAGALVVFAIIIIAGFQKDLGTAVSLIAIVASQLVMAGLSNKNMLRFGAIFLAMIVGLIIIAPHRLARMATFGNENCAELSAPESAGDYHICHAKIAIGSGGLFGVGIGNSVQATGYLPEAVNDSVFAIMGETFGFVGLIAILGLFLALLMRVLRIASHIENPASRILAAGVFGWLAVHVIMNVAAMIGLIPLTGITLPLLSFGGTSMMFISLILGLIYSLSRWTSFREFDDFKEGKDENSSSRRRVGRSRYSSRGGF
ncbi:MAG: FtsW/RodA/SpoVE family cell cycle protein [Candidatus Sacchiramonaceae bacterium]|nr:FtsW/RodA/SpoVE family cell cycle protein [Candidatus Saccharimonadaceae bacterium]